VPVSDTGPTAAELRTAAARLQQAADWLPGALDQAASCTGLAVWQGPAADRFSEALADQRRRLRSVADGILTLAGSFTTDAASREAQSAAPPLPGPPPVR